jgi:lysylphosphatidylglycerol synthetase-like protein (DUF2156 family)
VKAPSQSRRFALAPLWVAGLIGFGVAYRFAAPALGLPWNTAPLLAMAFGGGLFLGARLWWLPVAALVLSDLVLGMASPGEGIGWYSLVSAAFYALAASLGSLVRGRLPLGPTLWAGTLLCGVLFYGAANTLTWLILPEYAKSLAGWWQSQTTGLPQYSPPAWVFLRNSLLADSAWCAIAWLVWLAFRRELPSLPGKPVGPTERAAL